MSFTICCQFSGLPDRRKPITSDCYCGSLSKREENSARSFHWTLNGFCVQGPPFRRIYTSILRPRLWNDFPLGRFSHEPFDDGRRIRSRLCLSGRRVQAPLDHGDTDCVVRKRGGNYM